MSSGFKLNKCKCGKREIIRNLGMCWECYSKLHPIEKQKVKKVDNRYITRREFFEKVDELVTSRGYVTTTEMKKMIPKDKYVSWTRNIAGRLNVKRRNCTEYNASVYYRSYDRVPARLKVKGRRKKSEEPKIKKFVPRKKSFEEQDSLLVLQMEGIFDSAKVMKKYGNKIKSKNIYNVFTRLEGKGQIKKVGKIGKRAQYLVTMNQSENNKVLTNMIQHLTEKNKKEQDIHAEKIKEIKEENKKLKKELRQLKKVRQIQKENIIVKKEPKEIVKKDIVKEESKGIIAKIKELF